jgi:hypothetical protein
VHLHVDLGYDGQVRLILSLFILIDNNYLIDCIYRMEAWKYIAGAMLSPLEIHPVHPMSINKKISIQTQRGGVNHGNDTL